jgi:hypothetical protein
MSSKKAATNTEESLYEPIRDYLMGVFSKYIIPDKKPHYQTAPYEHEEKNLYLEITGKKRKFNEKLKKGFDDETLNIISSEGKFPDITGYVKRKRNSKKELITVEIKNGSIKLRDVIQARFYQEIFRAKFGLLVSSKGITEERVRFLLDKKIGQRIRGDVIIIRYFRNFYQKGRWIEIHPRFKNKVPDIFREYCKT